jgi:hypothetical protein
MGCGSSTPTKADPVSPPYSFQVRPDGVMLRAATASGHKKISTKALIVLAKEAAMQQGTQSAPPYSKRRERGGGGGGGTNLENGGVGGF